MLKRQNAILPTLKYNSMIQTIQFLLSSTLSHSYIKIILLYCLICWKRKAANFPVVGRSFEFTYGNIQYLPFHIRNSIQSKYVRTGASNGRIIGYGPPRVSHSSLQDSKSKSSNNFIQSFIKRTSAQHSIPSLIV